MPLVFGPDDLDAQADCATPSIRGVAPDKVLLGEPVRELPRVPEGTWI
jgi:hypothetical protein